MLSLFRLLIAIVAAMIGLAFGYANFQSTSVDLFWTQTQAPLVLLLAVAFVVGLIVAALICATRLVRMRAQLSSTRRKLKDAEAEISTLRSMPIHDA
ncbi:lipopolysaccharide assembly LapA domain-containing protein [Salinisphaera sp. Q1T1-3]|uniref:LapA family protein n=1 Tax=Salinisphaera sp. Q1T1-3 TaxID=2321229 RepID=UPI000E74D427|nr:LapA family protein [Salinisphaera sp. Q1T1-3]RJS92680.1 LapA family protein [Salinisphaera sp. Q1T1-3]